MAVVTGGTAVQQATTSRSRVAVQEADCDRVKLGGRGGGQHLPRCATSEENKIAAGLDQRIPDPGLDPALSRGGVGVRRYVELV